MDNRWWSYVTRLTDGASVNEIQRRSGVGPSVLSHWKTGRYKPRAEMAVSLARAYNSSPVEALIASDYLTREEIGETVQIAKRPSDFSDDELAREIQDLASEVARRLTAKARGKDPVKSDDDRYFFIPGERSARVRADG